MLSIITGSGFYALDPLVDDTTETVTTPYGDAVVTSGRWQGETPVLFLPRHGTCLLYTSPSPRDGLLYRMPSSA